MEQLVRTVCDNKQVRLSRTPSTWLMHLESRGDKCYSFTGIHTIWRSSTIWRVTFVCWMVSRRCSTYFAPTDVMPSCDACGPSRHRDDLRGYQLYQSDPSGNYGGWKATAIGANNQGAQNLLKQEYKEGLSLQEAIQLLVKASSGSE